MWYHLMPKWRGRAIGYSGETLVKRLFERNSKNLKKKLAKTL
jgi:hypothetical protein